MKYALYGNDIDDEHTPLEAGLGWIVKLDKASSSARPRWSTQKAEGVNRKLMGFELTERRHPAPRLPDPQGRHSGSARSPRGTMGPSVKKPIGMGYVPDRAGRRGLRLSTSRSAAARSRRGW